MARRAAPRRTAAAVNFDDTQTAPGNVYENISLATAECRVSEQGGRAAVQGVHSLLDKNTQWWIFIFELLFATLERT